MGTYLVIKNNIRRNLNHKLQCVVTFFIPLVLCLAAGFVNQSARPALRVGVISDTETGRDSIRKILNTEDFVYKLTSRETMNSDLITGHLQIILDYTGIKDGRQPVIHSVQNKNKPSGVIKSLTHTERAAAYLMTLFMVLSVVQGAVIITDKTSGTMERYCYSIQKKRSYYAGFYLHNLIMIFLQGSAALVIMRVMNGNWELSAFKGVLTAAVIALFSSAFASFVCAFSRSDMNANITASALTAIFSLLGGTFIAIESMPQLFRILSVISPIRWIIEFVRWI